MRRMDWQLLQILSLFSQKNLSVSISKTASQNMAKPIRTDGSTVTISKTASEIQQCRVFLLTFGVTLIV